MGLQQRYQQLLSQPAGCLCYECTALVYEDEPQCVECKTTRPEEGWPLLGTNGYDVLLGQIVSDKYLVTKRIGKGTSASVYRVLSRSLPKPYAAKILTADVFKEDFKHEWVIRTQREIDTMMRTNNPHIVSLHNVFALTGQSVCLVMDHIEGQTLEEYVPVNGLSIEVALRLTEQIALGIKSIHDLGVIHRDIKPENIMVTEISGQEPFVTLLDFGLVSGDERITKDFIGTPTFASPEICAGGLDVDQRSDIYSIGTVLFYLLTGQVPFPSKALFRVIHQKVTEDAPSLSTVRSNFPPKLVAFVDGLLRKDKLQRPGSIVAMLNQMQKLKRELHTLTMRKSTLDWVKDGRCLIASRSQEHDQLIKRCFDHPSQCQVVFSADQLLAVQDQNHYDLMFVSLKLPRLRELKVFHHLRKKHSRFVVIVPETAGDSALDMLEMIGVPYLLEPLNVELVSNCVTQMLD